MTGKTHAIVTLRFAWSPPSGRVTAIYRAEVIRHEPESRRDVCRLIELIEVTRAGSGETISDARLRGLIGQCARVPHEALTRDMILPLKIATLTGGLRRPYFFDELSTPPRRKDSPPGRDDTEKS